MDKSKIYVGSLNSLDTVRQGEQLVDTIELVEITLREEVVFDARLTLSQKAQLAKALDDLGVPTLQLHAQGCKEVISACRDAGVRARMEVECRPYHPYGYANWKEEIRVAVGSGADLVHPSITTPRKWILGEPAMSVEGIKQRALDAVKLAFDLGAPKVTLGFTDAPRTDLGFLIETGRMAGEAGASTLVLNDTVGVAKPSLMRFLVQKVTRETGVKVRVHCHNDFGLGTANTLAALDAGAGGAEVAVNGSDPARSGIAPLAEIVMALMCLYEKDLGYATEKLTEVSRLFSKCTGMPIDEQKPIVADRNWMYKRDHIMRTIVLDESIQFPYSPGLIGQSFQIDLGRGVGAVGVGTKLRQLGLDVPEAMVARLVDQVNEAAVEKKRRLTDAEFRALAEQLRRSL
ncbi:MAG: hypothetical protein HYV93_15325 [Candidatus Rokubacteria bacterium]|nr:hypothetical protein [Candidatus Rokubacteria bacterium]